MKPKNMNMNKTGNNVNHKDTVNEQEVEVVTEVDTEENNAEPKIAVVCNCEKVRVRKSPNGKELAIVDAGTEFDVIEEGDMWTSVNFNGSAAYVMSEFLSIN